MFRYVDLWKRSFAAKQYDWISELSEDESAIIEKMENRLDFEHIITFRSLSRAEFNAECDKKKLLDASKNSQSSKNGGWWGMVFGQPTESVDSDVFR